MSKSISAKIDTYTKDGQQKGKYVEIGVILNNQNGDYIMLNPTVDLAGVVLKQQALAVKEGKKVGSNIMCSIFDNDRSNSSTAPQNNQNHQPQPQNNNEPPVDEVFDDIPF